MDQLNIPSFGGVAGRVLKEAFSFQTWITGFLFMAVVVVFGYMTSVMGVEDGGFFMAHLIVPVIACRYALNGYHGEWRGSVFSPAGGSWLEVGLVAFRYAALAAVWLVPLTALGANPTNMVPSGLTILYMTAWIMSPPLMLIMAISAPNFAVLFSPSAWSNTFKGRSGDLITLYVAYTGVITSVAFLSVPVVLGLGFIHRSLAIAALVVIGPLALGLMLSVLGRLCGFFPITGSTDLGEPASPTPEDAPAKTLSGKPVLSNARERIEGVIAEFESDTQGTIEALEDLRSQHDPHPLLLHALCLLHFQSGDKDRSFSLAEEALPFLLHHGNIKLSAEIFLLHEQRRSEFQLEHGELMQIGDHLRSDKEHDQALKIYRDLLAKNPVYTKAIKAVMQIADDRAHHGALEEAADLYRWLLDRCSESPLAEYMWGELKELERKLA